jgi:hypothetical protein
VRSAPAPGVRAPLAAQTLIEKENGMEFPSETKPALWGAAGGAILLAIVGFTWGGWMTTSAANKLADQRADTAVVAILTPICVEKFQQNGEAIANLAALKKISSTWEQGNFVEKGGWATRPGASSPDYILARACAEKLVQAKSAAQ